MTTDRPSKLIPLMLHTSIVALAFVSVWALYCMIILPIVYESYTTGNCVRVDDVRGVYACENMPRKYHHQWTQ